MHHAKWQDSVQGILYNEYPYYNDDRKQLWEVLKDEVTTRTDVVILPQAMVPQRPYVGEDDGGDHQNAADNEGDQGR